MRVIAKHWLNCNGVWHKGGEEFEVDNFEEIKDLVEVKGFVSDVFPPKEEQAPAKRRGRPRKSE